MKNQIIIDQNEKINQAYSDDPWWYDARGFLIFKFAYRSSLIRQIIFFAKNIQDQHLEAAIGSGSLFKLILLYRRFFRFPICDIDGFDYADRMIYSAKKKLRSFSEVHLFKADACATKLPSNQYHSINIANALHCIPELDVALAEFHRLLKPHGTLCGNCLLYPQGNSFLDKISNRINNWGIKKGILIRPYTQKEIKNALEEAQLKIIFENIEGNCFNFIAQKQQ